MPGSAVALRSEETGREVAVVGSAPVAAEMSWAETVQLGKVLAASGYFKDVRGEAQAIVKILYGRELGIGPVTALMSVHVVEGKPAASANLVAARIRASGRYDYRVREQSAATCRVEFFIRASAKWESLGIIEWSMEDAQRAQLLGRGNWKTYPRAMLFARAITEGARVHCPEIFGGAPVYTPEELGAEVDGEGNPIGGPDIGPEMMTPEQMELMTKLRRSHCFTDDEQEGLERRLQRGMTKAQAQSALDWMLGVLKERKAAEAQGGNAQPAISDRIPGADDEPDEPSGPRPFSDIEAEEIAHQETLGLPEAKPAPRRRNAQTEGR